MLACIELAEMLRADLSPSLRLCLRFYLLFFVRFAPFRGYSDLTFLPPHLRKSAFICGSSVFSLRLCVRFYFAYFRVHSRLSFAKRRPIQSELGPSPLPPPAVPV